MTWISNNKIKYHYHTGYKSICNKQDVLKNPTFDCTKSNNPSKKCRICQQMLKSEKHLIITLEKNRNKINKSKFISKYKTTPLRCLLNYLTSPENIPISIDDVCKNIGDEFDKINIKDILYEALIGKQCSCKEGNLYPKMVVL